MYKIIACDNIPQAQITQLVLQTDYDIDYGSNYLIYNDIAYQMLPTFVTPHKIPHSHYHIPLIEEDITNTDIMLIPKDQWKGIIKTF